ncbi:hypothetical protein ABG768_014796 [Culter alburnus]|uniref:Uncharacterized protein n=1 Tax=Culter alburnus TaxID=194366 RepID=A0AAW1Z0D1_CULAL
MFPLFSSSQVSHVAQIHSDVSDGVTEEIQMERRKKITHPENCWSLRNHRAAENKKTEREMETQTSESQERRGERRERCSSMNRLKPNLSCDPEDPVKIDSDVKTEERLSHQNLHQ